MENKKKTIISREKALEFAVHFGHQPRRWNPAMKPFIHSAINGTHIINVNKTIASLEFSYKQIKKIAEKDGSFLFVGTTGCSKQAVKENAIRTGSFYVNHRWLGGTLTNFKTIQNSVKRLRTLERLQKDNYKGYTKKEGVEMERELVKLERQLGGIKFMRRTPSALIVSSINSEMIAIKEAKKKGIPVFAIADTNSNPSLVTFPIPANDDSSKSVGIIMTALADAIAVAKNDKPLVSFVEDENLKVVGVIETKKEHNRELLSRSSRSNLARTKSIKSEKIEEIKTNEVRKEHNQEVEKQEDNQDFTKLTIPQIKKYLDERKIEYPSTAKKADLIEIITKK